MRRLALLVVIIVLVLGVRWALASRAAHDATRASEVVRSFINSVSHNDDATALSTLTRAARAQIGGNVGARTHTSGSTDYQVGDAHVQGDAAQVPVEFKTAQGAQQARFLLRREEGAWKLYGIALKAPDGADITFDMEHPAAVFGDLMREVGKGIGQAMKGAGEGAAAALQGFADGLGSAVHDSSAAKR